MKLDTTESINESMIYFFCKHLTLYKHFYKSNIFLVGRFLYGNFHLHLISNKGVIYSITFKGYDLNPQYITVQDWVKDMTMK